jgi:hypothetical protein
MSAIASYIHIPGIVLEVVEENDLFTEVLFKDPYLDVMLKYIIFETSDRIHAQMSSYQYWSGRRYVIRVKQIEEAIESGMIAYAQKEPKFRLKQVTGALSIDLESHYEVGDKDDYINKTAFLEQVKTIFRELTPINRWINIVACIVNIILATSYAIAYFVEGNEHPMRWVQVGCHLIIAGLPISMPVLIRIKTLIKDTLFLRQLDKQK